MGVELRSQLLLSLQRALLDRVGPNLTAVGVSWTDSIISLWFYLDQPASPEELEDIDDLETEVIADLTDPFDVHTTITWEVAPDFRREDLIWAFRRKGSASETMLTRLFWVPEAAPYRLAFMPRPQGGEDLSAEIKGWQAAGISTVVSLLEPFEASYLNLAEEGAHCQGAGIEFVSFPIGDRGLPTSFTKVQELVSGIVERLKAGKAVSIHCRVGIGRSGLITACVLLHLGVPMAEVFPALIRARGVGVPDTAEQAMWVEEYARWLK